MDNRYGGSGRFQRYAGGLSAPVVSLPQLPDQAGAPVLGQSTPDHGLYTKNTSIPAGVRGTNPKLILGAFRTWAKSQVGILFFWIRDYR